MTLVPMVLILLEPDLGTVMLMMPVLFTMLFVAGALRIKHLAMIVLLAVAVSPALWFMLKPYQRERISSVLLQSRWVREKRRRTWPSADFLSEESSPNAVGGMNGAIT